MAADDRPCRQGGGEQLRCVAVQRGEQRNAGEDVVHV
jgi:hypothetical protein